MRGVVDADLDLLVGERGIVTLSFPLSRSLRRKRSWEGISVWTSSVMTRILILGLLTAISVSLLTMAWLVMVKTQMMIDFLAKSNWETRVASLSLLGKKMGWTA